MRQNFFYPIVCMVFFIENPQCGNDKTNRNNLASIHLANKDYFSALLETKRHQREYGHDSKSLLISTYAHLGLSHHKEALKSLTKAISLSPSDINLHQILRDVCRKHTLVVPAHLALKKLLDYNSNEPQIYASLAWLENELGNFHAAKAMYNSALTLDPNLLLARIELSRLTLSKGDFETAEQILMIGIEKTPANYELLLALAECQLRQNQEKKANATLLRATQAGCPPDQIANLYSKEGFTKRAISYYQKAIAKKPNDGRLLNNLAWSYAELGTNLEYASKLSLRALQLAGPDINFMDTFAELLYLQGYYDHASAIIRRAIVLNKTDKQHSDYLQEQYNKIDQALFKNNNTREE